MSTSKLSAGATFPVIGARGLDGDTDDVGAPGGDDKWKMVVVYRGQHCPLCTKFLNRLEGYLDMLRDSRVEVVAVSGDSREQLESHLPRLDVSFPLYYGLRIEQMQELGLYVSHPRSAQETDHPFPEPGLFVINEERQLQVVDISNNPFVRPELEALVSGLAWIRDPDNNYPIRGTYE